MYACMAYITLAIQSVYRDVSVAMHQYNVLRVAHHTLTAWSIALVSVQLGMKQCSTRTNGQQVWVKLTLLERKRRFSIDIRL